MRNIQTQPESRLLKPIKVSKFHLRIPFNSFRNERHLTKRTIAKERRYDTTTRWAETKRIYFYFYIFHRLRFLLVFHRLLRHRLAPTFVGRHTEKFLSGNEVNRCFILSVLSRFSCFRRKSKIFVNKRQTIQKFNEAPQQPDMMIVGIVYGH